MDLENFPFDQALCLGVAGNVAGHMEQAGECLRTEKRHNGPKGLFPTFVPGLGGHLGHYPGGNQILRIQSKGDFQIEPELGLVGKIHYKNGHVHKLEPLGVCAYEDLTLRDPKIPLFSQKKNWGLQTKGFGNVLPIHGSFKKGLLKKYRIACWHRRSGNWYEYAVDTKVEEYSYFYHELLDWILHRLQVGVDDPGFENLKTLIEQSTKPEYFAIGCGATCYTEWGHYVYMKKTDAAAVILYEGDLLSASEILGHLAYGKELPRKASVLVQEIKGMRDA